MPAGEKPFTARYRAEPDVKLPCGHWANLLGSVYEGLSALGKLEQWCDRCGEWRVVPKPKKYKPKKDKGVPLFLCFLRAAVRRRITGAFAQGAVRKGDSRGML